MADDTTLHSPFDEHFRRIEPVVFLEDDLYVMTDRPGDGVEFVTALGVAHPLRRLCSRRTLDEQLARRNAGAIARSIRSGLVRLRADNGPDDLRYFVESLHPAFETRDWSEQFDLDMPREPAEPPPPVNTAGETDALARACPTAIFPSPSCLLLGRFSVLRPGSGVGVDHVRQGHETLRPTGEVVTTGQVDRRWREAVTAFVGQAVASLATAAGDEGPDSMLTAAREEVARSGHVQRGDLLFLAGPPPRVGHVLPPHYNRMLGRQSHGDLAMTVALTRPPRIAIPQVFARDTQGRWLPLHLPNGLCLGGDPPGFPPEAPGIVLLAYLRWAAVRVACNGAFHANDNQPTEY